MKIEAERKQQLYALTEKLFQWKTGMTFQWRTNEKAKVVESFVLFSVTSGLEEDDDFDYLFGIFSSYVKERTVRWIRWSEASRANFIGTVFLPRGVEERMQMFLVKMLEADSNESQVAVTQQATGAGTKTKSKWDF